MSTVTKLADLETILAGVNGVFGQFMPLIPIFSTGILKLWKLWKTDNPDGTEADFIASLATEAGIVKGTSADFLTAKGYTLVNGEWVAPTPPAEG